MRAQKVRRVCVTVFVYQLVREKTQGHWRESIDPLGAIAIKLLGDAFYIVILERFQNISICSTESTLSNETA